MTPHSRILIVGGGPVGLCLAGLLAHHGIASVVIEQDPAYCSGSRAICVSRRSQEIFQWFGAGDALQTKGLPWTGGRSYFRETQVLQFQMPHDPAQRFAPMLNIQQFYIEQYAHEAGQRTGLVQTLWGHTFVSLAQSGSITNPAVKAIVKTPQGELIELHGNYLVACDGGRSAVREHLGLQLQGTQYEGRYVIADIKQTTQRAVERLAWFDPPSNPGSTILMHRQPDDVWRIDYQIPDHEDPFEAVKPENVLPRVQSHLTMIGEHAPWEPLWISIYNAKCLTLNNYRHQNVFFAGDAAHLVPIFGVRGLNSGLDDAANLAWKLAATLKYGLSSSQIDLLLNSYNAERLQATHENLAYGAKSTEFMAPPNTAFSLLRQAVLRLAVHSEAVRSLINPRQSLPVNYGISALNCDAPSLSNNHLINIGGPAPDAPFCQHDATHYLSSFFGLDFICLQFGALKAGQLQGATCIALIQNAEHAIVFERYGFGIDERATVLVRPDGYILGYWLGDSLKPAQAALNHIGFESVMIRSLE